MEFDKEKLLLIVQENSVLYDTKKCKLSIYRSQRKHLEKKLQPSK